MIDHAVHWLLKPINIEGKDLDKNASKLLSVSGGIQ